MKLVDQSKPTPLYHQVKDILVNRIQNKIWLPGNLIPTEQELIEEFGVSRTTIRQAISAMVQDGLLERRQGKGTIVNSPKLVGTLGRLTGFAEEVMEKGHLPRSKVLRAGFYDHLYIEKNKLQVPEDSKILVIERIRFADNDPIAYERTCWPEKIGEVLMQHDLEGAKYYQILEAHGMYLKRADETIKATNATIDEANLLGISPGEALLEMKRLSFGIDDHPIEFTRTKYRSDRYQYSIELKR
ncbi:GntR family transcriptional regulator [Thalassobacillus pellis]|uniref:GntR family transcriptional regulator n=1 Tax=Thalassobacillus pellis TaxID=748008 RepID=UPI001960CC7C|nr:GntR family transcriptional regulator [Thalassobacillus pellis]MBM7554450.1 GntR family transcriptional regulator [Thalassobacillus pellis]